MANPVDNVVGLYIRDKNKNTIIKELRHGEIFLGRGFENDVKFDDPTVSASHARIYTYLTVSYIEDLGSTNGTFVNGKRIERQVLHPGDVISLGEYQIVLEKRGTEELKKQATKTAS